MYKSSDVNQYKKIDLEAEVAHADPHRLVQMLFEGALMRLSRAKLFMEQEDYEAKNAALGRVVEIIGTLQEALDADKGGQVATQLDQLYDYMLRRLLIANKDNSPEVVDEVIKLLAEIKQGWDGIREEYLKSEGVDTAASDPNIPPKMPSESIKA